MTARWLNAREWLEYERLTGLPHADFAAEAIRMVDEGEDHAEKWGELVDDVWNATSEELEKPEDVIDCYRWRQAVLTALVNAGVHEDGEDLTADAVKGLLAMFLPC